MNNPAPTVRYAVLEALRRRAKEWSSEDDLSRELLVSRAEVRRCLLELRAEGYLLERQRTGTCRFKGCRDRLIPHELTRKLKTEIIGRRLIVHQSVPSTNDAAWQEALAGAEEGTTIFSEEQTAGRGRLGRRWFAQPGTSLIMSVILRPALDVQRSSLLTVMSSVAVAQALRECVGVQARIRWPNDVTIGGRKVAGILVEGRSLATGSVFVLGLGLNVNTRLRQFPPELRDIATSLLIETGTLGDRIEVARSILSSLDLWYREFRLGNHGRIARFWRRLSDTLGERVALLENGREFRGRVLDLSMEDGLIVRLDGGVTRLFHPSTVTLRQLPDRHEGGLRITQ